MIIIPFGIAGWLVSILGTKLLFAALFSFYLKETENLLMDSQCSTLKINLKTL